MKQGLLIIPLLLTISISFSEGTFTNPLIPSGFDPWVIYKDGWFYYMNTVISSDEENELKLWRTRNLANLPTAENKQFSIRRIPPYTQINYGRPRCTLWMESGMYILPQMKASIFTTAYGF